jgi:hypothetical protein
MTASAVRELDLAQLVNAAPKQDVSNPSSLMQIHY